MIKESKLIGTKVSMPYGWHEFKVGDLFQVIIGNRQDMSSSGRYPVIKAKTGDNGYAGFADTYDLAFGLTIGMRGSFNVYVQKSPVALGTNTAGLVLKDDSISDTRVLVYLGTMLHRENYEGSSGYVGYPTLKRLTQIDTILLPVTQDGQPDYGWMSSYIRELENQRIRELDTYLQVTGLDDTILTDNELQVLEQWRQHEKFGGTLLTKRFSPLELFDLENSPVDNVNNSLVGRVSAGEGVNGVSDMITTDLYDNNIITISKLGQTFYHNQNVSWTDDVLGLKLKYRNDMVGLFLSTIIDKQTRCISSYGHQFRMKRLHELIIELPATVDDMPDYDFMETFIRAQEKLVMQNLAEFRQRQIDTTRQII